MKKTITIVASFFLLMPASGQTNKKINTYLWAQYNQTLYDRTLGNNPWSIGAGLQVLVNTRGAARPAVEFSVNGSLADDKVLRLTDDTMAVDDARSFICLFAGSSFLLSKKIYCSFLLGPAFINGHTYFGVKPSVGFYFSGTRRVAGRFSYTNIFNRAYNYKETQKDDFGLFSIAVGVKLF